MSSQSIIPLVLLLFATCLCKAQNPESNHSNTPGPYKVLSAQWDSHSTSASIVKATIYPNPGIGLVALKRNRAFQKATVRVLSRQGKVFLTKKQVHGKVCGLDMGRIPTGIYFVEITEGEAREVVIWEKQ